MTAKAAGGQRLVPPAASGMQRWFRRALRAAAVTLALVAAAMPLAAQVETLPPDHWAYAEIEHFESRGFLALPGIRPYTRAEVRRWVEGLVAARDSGAAFTRVETQRLARLEDEFVRGADIENARVRFDPPVIGITEANWGFTADVDGVNGGASGWGSAAGADSDGTAWSRTQFDALLRYRDRVAYETRYRLTLAPEEGTRTGENTISSRERNWHGLTSNLDRAYVSAGGPRFRVVLGRDYLSWGSRRGGELLVSDAGLSADALQVHLRLRRFRLASVAAMLSAAENRNYAAHRLEVDLGPVQVGVQEAVVYVSPHLEPTYLFPLTFYYGNQFNERGDDNVLLGLDAHWTGRCGVLDGELLVDDFIYDGDPAPNKLGGRLGWRRGFPLGGTDLQASAAYTAITRWTYTHRDTINTYVAGSGSIARGEPWLGNSLGPDADRWEAALAWSPDVRWNLGLQLSRTRRGAGNRDPSPWQPGTPYSLPFPSGPVQTETWAGLGAHVLLGRRAGVSAGTELGWTPSGRELRLVAEARFDL
jgi:hypothetical protein